MQIFILFLVTVLFIPVLLGGALALLGLLWSLAASAVRVRRLRRIRQDHYGATHDADGTPLHPTARGLCEGCERVLRKVHHLPDGRRLCESCYRAEREEGRSGEPPEPAPRREGGAKG
jgi:hypothetical protein